MSVAYSYDGTFDGFLSCVFAAYFRRETPEEIVAEGCLQEVFGREAIHTQTNTAHARRVESGIVKSLGSACYQKIWTVFLSGELDKATLLYRYIRRGFEIGRGIYNNISHPDVVPIEDMHKHITHEAHLLTGFARFSEMEGGVFYAKITPKNSVVPLIMPHFAGRLNVQPFLLHDAAHGIVGVYNLQGWHLVETETLNVPKLTSDELAYRRMWKKFYDTVAIPERLNPICRRSHMPLRFWPNMTEHSYIPPDKNERKEALTTEAIICELDGQYSLPLSTPTYVDIL